MFDLSFKKLSRSISFKIFFPKSVFSKFTHTEEKFFVDGTKFLFPFCLFLIRFYINSVSLSVKSNKKCHLHTFNWSKRALIPFFSLFFYRFMAIWWPLKKQITKKRAKAMIFGIWLFALFLTSPWLIYFELTTMFDSRPDIEMCYEIWPQHEWFNETSFFIVANLCMRFLLPTILIFVCYTLIWVKVSILVYLKNI